MEDKGMLEVIEKEGKLHCIFKGSLDTGNCWHLEKLLDEKTAGKDLPIVFDLKEVDFISSAFIRLCIKTYNRVGAEKFSIINANEDVRKVFDIAALDLLD
jgi:anti-anti-sigma factor